MIIDFNKIKIYYLTTGTSPEKEKHLEEIFKNFNLKKVSVNKYLRKGKEQSACIGINKIIDFGLREQKVNEGFSPFAIIEDDVSIYDEIPNQIEIPDDTDFLYIGICKKGLIINKNRGLKNNVYADDIDNNLVRVYNMLSTHGMIICSAAAAATYQRSNMENYYNVDTWDHYLCKLQPYYNFYALKKPIVYQDEKYGGQEYVTKFELTTYIKNNGHIFKRKKTISNLMASNNDD